MRTCPSAPPTCGGGFDEAPLLRELTDIETEVAAPDFWKDQTGAQRVLQRRRRLEDDRTLAESLRKQADDLGVLIDWARQGEDVTADLARGLSHIRQMDPRFDSARFAEPASDIFFRVQAAWMARDMDGVRPVLTEEMAASMQAQCDQLRAQRRVNRLENIAVRAVDLAEAWQERGQDFVSVRFLASLLDFTTDEGGTQVIEGSRTEPVKFEEYWTFTRPVGPGLWRLSAIQQAA